MSISHILFAQWIWCVIHLLCFGKVPKSNWAGMIIKKECGDWDKWNCSARCTVTMHQPQAAGALVQTRTHGENGVEFVLPPFFFNYNVYPIQQCVILSDSESEWGHKPAPVSPAGETGACDTCCCSPSSLTNPHTKVLIKRKGIWPLTKLLHVHNDC